MPAGAGEQQERAEQCYSTCDGNGLASELYRSKREYGCFQAGIHSL